MLTHHGTRWRGERLEERRQKKTDKKWGVGVLHGLLPGQTKQTVDGSSCEVYLMKGFFGIQGTDSPMLKTSDVNQNALTAFAAGPTVSPYENCKLVAVTEEKKVAIVDRLRRFSAACVCANRIAGTPESSG
jgi:hypothetical protein